MNPWQAMTFFQFVRLAAPVLQGKNRRGKGILFTGPVQAILAYRHFRK